MLSVFFKRAILTLALAAALASVPGNSACAGREPGEYEVKAAFLYNFLSFVEWPNSLRISPSMKICVMGDPSFAAAFSGLNSRMVGNRRLSVAYRDSVDGLGDCHVVYLGPALERDLPRIMKAIEGTNILTVGDTAGLGRQGAVINFYLEKNRVRFEINLSAARRQGLTISSKLLKLAGAVYGAPREQD